jgi:hypothetical protein
VVEAKDFVGALAGAAATLAGFALVLFGIVTTTDEAHGIGIYGKTRALLVYGMLGTFLTSLVSTIACVMWLFEVSAVRHTVMTPSIRPLVLYDAAWVAFLVTVGVLLLLLVVGLIFHRNDRAKSRATLSLPSFAEPSRRSTGTAEAGKLYGSEA